MNELGRVEEKLLEYLRTQCQADLSIDVDTDVIDSGLLDSMLVMDLVLFVESQFTVKLEPTDIAPHNLRSVRCLAACVRGIWNRNLSSSDERPQDGTLEAFGKSLVGCLVSGFRGLRT